MRHQDALRTLHSDPFQLDTLIAYLETKDPREEYEYGNMYSCCLARYFKAKGFVGTVMSFNAFQYYDKDDKVVHADLPEGFDQVARAGSIGGTRTFGMALRTARSLAQ